MRKMAAHGQSVWMQEFHSSKNKGRYHINVLGVFLEGNEVRGTADRWTTVAQMNNQKATTSPSAPVSTTRLPCVAVPCSKLACDRIQTR